MPLKLYLEVKMKKGREERKKRKRPKNKELILYIFLENIKKVKIHFSSLFCTTRSAQLMRKLALCQGSYSKALKLVLEESRKYINLICKGKMREELQPHY